MRSYLIKERNLLKVIYHFWPYIATASSYTLLEKTMISSRTRRVNLVKGSSTQLCLISHLFDGQEQ